MYRRMKAILLAILLVFITSCTSKIKAIETAFVNESYSWERLTDVDENTEDSGVKAIYFTQKGITSLALIIELQTGKDALVVVEAIKEDPNLDGEALLQAMLQAYDESPITNGNCIIVTLSPDAITIFQAA